MTRTENCLKIAHELEVAVMKARHALASGDILVFYFRESLEAAMDEAREQLRDVPDAT